MRIGIEAQRIFRSHKYGMDIVAIELIRHLQKIDTENEYIIFVSPGKDICIHETVNFKIQYIKSSIYPIWEQILFPIAVKRANVDIVHCTSNTAPLKLCVPFVLTLHDIISLEPSTEYSMSFYQEMGRIYRRWLIPIIVSKCKHLITVSQIEKQHICQKMPETKNKISVIHNGVDRKFQPIDKIGQRVFHNKYQLPEQFISFIGNTDPRKNACNVLFAYSVYLKQSKDKTPLVILHFNKRQLMRMLKRLSIVHILPYIKLLDYLDVADMPAFYAASKMFLFPSLREGFGMPVLEAMACGAPVITSKVSSMPEVAGDAALLVDPFDMNDIALNMLFLEEHPEKVGDLRRKGLVHARDFSWENSTQKILETYKNVVNSIGK